VTLDPTTFELKTLLAEEITPNATGTEWTIRLRDGVEFHNGKTLSADDLVFTMKHALDPKTASPNAAGLKYLDPKSMKKLDNRTLRVKMVRPYLFNYSFYQALFVMPEGWDPKKPVGTGPFKFVSFSPGHQSVFTANDRYWQGRPFVDELHLIDLTDDTARVNAQLGGQTDMLVSVPYGSVAAIRSNPGQKLIQAANDGYLPFIMNCAAAPFDDVRVRQAFKLLVDRKQMIDTALSGYGRVGNDLYSPHDPVFDRSIPQTTQDLEKAKALLKAAGHQDTTFTFTAVPLVAGALEAPQVLAQNAKAAGVKLHVKQVDIQTYFNGLTKFPFVSSQWPPNPWITALVASDGPKASYPETHFGDVDKQFATVANQLLGEVDEAKRKQLAAEAQQMQHDRGGLLIWGFQDTVDAASSKLTGYVERPTDWNFGDFAFRHVSFTT
jgi:peptide/nickel transport system substrate-binding protein